MLVLKSTLKLNSGPLSMHGGENGFELVLGVQTDAEEALYKAGVSRDLLNRMTGRLLEVKD